ncbi:DMT family transporter [Hyphococcus sp. DH-69]|uniref:DMT family transporter n=1 Tax=Hyphococcus formosus TaxID=3143534 RepID=UPI00398B3E52
MTAPTIDNRRANLIGGLWMIASMAAFAFEDVFIKAASKTLPIGEILMLFGLGGAIIFASVLIINKEPLFVPDVISPPMRARAGFEIGGRLFYVLAISLTPLSAATVILQATPLVVVAGAALFFGEQVGWRRWTAIIIGMVGVIVIIRPGADSFSLLSILAVLGMLGFAGRDLASRAAPKSLSTAILGLYGFLAVIVAGILFSLYQRVPLVSLSTETMLILAGSIIAGVSGYACLMKAMRTGEVSAVTPFRYSRLLFGIACGIVLFGETLTLSMIIGSGLIVVSGMFIMARSRDMKIKPAGTKKPRAEN